MADPITWAAIITAGAAVFSGVTAMQTGDANQEAFNLQAKQEEEAGRQRVRAIESKSRRLSGVQRAQFAAAGVNLSGSVLDVQQDSINESRIDAMTTMQNSFNQSASLRFQGNVAKSEGINSAISSGFDAAGAVVGGVGQYNQYKATTGQAPTWRVS